MAAAPPPSARGGAGERAAQGGPPAAALAAALAGEYRSEELDVVYRIERRAGDLVLVRPRAPDRAIRSDDGGALSAGDLRLHPVRGAAGDVTGFTVEAGRVRDIRFTRTR